MKFSKWHALGNEYLLIDNRDFNPIVNSLFVQRVCNRYTGVGSDGVLEIHNIEGNNAEIIIWNPDGSRAELSGNGVRIAARWLAREIGIQKVIISTGGRSVPSFILDGLLVKQDMGRINVGEIELIEVEEDRVEFIPVEIGNPHAVLVHDPDEREVARLGPLIEQHQRFPDRTNVQLIRVDTTHALTVGVWERGVGLTASSGTSACAAAAAAASQGWVKSPIAVSLPGGVLEVLLEGNQVQLKGPAQEICNGEISAELLAEIS